MRINSQCPYSEEFDATDFACPAWWRGETYGSKAMLTKVKEFFFETDRSGVHSGDIECVRDWIHCLRKNSAAGLRALGQLEMLKAENAVLMDMLEKERATK